MSADRLTRLALVGAVLLSLLTGVLGLTRWLGSGSEAPLLGPDFAMFYTAASLGSEGRWDEVYDLESFNRAFEDVFGTVAFEGGASFAYPPLFAQTLRPLTSLSVNTAFLVWSALAVAAIVAALVLLEPRRLFSAPLLLLSVPTYVLVRLGQASWLAFLVASTAVFLLRRRREVAAGVALALLVFKPPLLLGVGLWLLVDRQRARVAQGLFGSLGLLCAFSAITAPSAWRSWGENLLNLAAPNDIRSPWDYSIAGWLRETGTPWWGWAVGLLLASGALGASIAGFRRLKGDVLGGFALAIAVTIALAPRALVYDWLLLAISLVAVARCERLADRQRHGLIALVLVATTAGYWPVDFGPGRAPIAIVLLVIALVAGVRGLSYRDPVASTT